MALPDLHDHLCQVCGRFGSHGFGPPGLDATIRWYCAIHQGIGARWWAEMSGANGAGLATFGPAQNTRVYGGPIG